MILLKTSPPYSGKLQLHIKINWYLMYNFPVHKHKNSHFKQWNTNYTFTFGPKIVTNQIHNKKMCFKMLKWPWHFGPFLLNNDRICHTTRFNKKGFSLFLGGDTLKDTIIRSWFFTMHHRKHNTYFDLTSCLHFSWFYSQYLNYNHT
jgi:hypothetical protein